MDAADPDDCYETNGAAFQAREVRVGPPLSYVAEKLRNAVEQSHRAYHSAASLVPELPIPESYGPDFKFRDVFSTKDVLILSPIRGAFHYSLKAYLALNNMLNLPGGDNVEKDALAMDSTTFELWLDKIDSEGSVT